MPDVSILKSAADRVSKWEVQHGVFADWHFDTIGVTLTATCGGDKVEKRASWFELEQARYPAHTLERLEEAALQGLSN